MIVNGGGSKGTKANARVEFSYKIIFGNRHTSDSTCNALDRTFSKKSCQQSELMSVSRKLVKSAVRSRIPAIAIAGC